MATTMQRDKVVRRGTEAFTVLQLLRVVSIDMPTSNYEVYYKADGLLVNASTSAKTATSFTINLSVGIAGSLSWIAVEN